MNDWLLVRQPQVRVAALRCPCPRVRDSHVCRQILEIMASDCCVRSLITGIGHGGAIILAMINQDNLCHMVTTVFSTCDSSQPLLLTVATLIGQVVYCISGCNLSKYLGMSSALTSAVLPQVSFQSKKIVAQYGSASLGLWGTSARPCLSARFVLRRFGPRWKVGKGKEGSWNGFSVVGALEAQSTLLL